LFLEEQREIIFIKEGLRPHEPKVFRFSFYFGFFIFSLFFLENKREMGLNKGPKAPMNQRFSDSLFILGSLFSLCFFWRTRERKDFYKGGPSAPMNQRFSDSLFILCCLFSLCFFARTERKGFLLSKQSFEQGFV